MRFVGYSCLGLALGAATGFALGLFAGAILADAARVSCFEGACAALALKTAWSGAAGVGAIGFGWGLRNAWRGRNTGWNVAE